MRIAIGCDHTGPQMKRALIASVLAKYELIDKGTDSTEPVDYPDIAQAVAHVVAEGKAERGILICGTGIGIIIGVDMAKKIVKTWLSTPFDGGRHARRVGKIE